MSLATKGGEQQGAFRVTTTGATMTNRTYNVCAINIAPVIGYVEGVVETDDERPLSYTKNMTLKANFGARYPGEIRDLSKREAVTNAIEYFLHDLLFRKGRDYDRIVFSAIGVVRRERGSVIELARPGWDGFATFSFRDLVKKIHPKIVDRVDVYNETTCAAMAEYVFPSTGTSPIPVIESLGRNNRRAPVGAFIRFGEGVNASFVVDNMPWRSNIDTEIGHIIPPKASIDLATGYAGQCKYHHGAEACYEGLLSVSALQERRKFQARHKLPELDRNLMIELVAHYLGHLCHAITSTVAPSRIAIAGRGLDMFLPREGERSALKEQLLAAIRQRFQQIRRGYPDFTATWMDRSYIVEGRFPWQDDSLLGALVLGAQRVLGDRRAAR